VSAIHPFVGHGVLDRRDERIDTRQAHAFHLDGRHDAVQDRE
jgi:hypothetical protein